MTQRSMKCEVVHINQLCQRCPSDYSLCIKVLLPRFLHYLGPAMFNTRLQAHRVGQISSAGMKMQAPTKGSGSWLGRTVLSPIEALEVKQALDDTLDDRGLCCSFSQGSGLGRTPCSGTRDTTKACVAGRTRSRGIVTLTSGSAYYWNICSYICIFIKFRDIQG